MNIGRALFEPRFNRLEMYGMPVIVWAAMAFQNVELMILAVPLVLASWVGESRLNYRERTGA